MKYLCAALLVAAAPAVLVLPAVAAAPLPAENSPQPLLSELRHRLAQDFVPLEDAGNPSVRQARELLLFSLSLVERGVEPVAESPALEDAMVYWRALKTPPAPEAVRGYVRLLLEAGVDPCRPGVAGKQPLQRAVWHGLPEVCRALLEGGALPLLPEAAQQEMLADAVCAAHPDILALLLEAGVKCAPQDALSLVLLAIDREGVRRECHRPPLPPAAESCAVLHLLLQAGLSANGVDAYGDTPLHRAAAREDGSELCRLLLAAGADANARNEKGYTPLDIALDRSRASAILLHEAGATRAMTPAERENIILGRESALRRRLQEIKLSERQLAELLGYAVQHGSAACVQVLLEAGANPDAKLAGYDSAVVCLALARDASTREEKLELLLRAGSRPSVWAAQWAMWKKCPESLCLKLLKTSRCEEDAECLPLLLESAAEYGSVALCRYLLEKGAPAAGISEYYCRPLAKAAEAGHVDVCRLLLAAGAPPDGGPPLANSTDDSPLLRAALLGHAEVVELLLAAGAPVGKKDSEEQSILLKVARRGGEYWDPEEEKMVYGTGGRVAWSDNAGRRAALSRCCELMLAAGASMPRGWTPLHLAAQLGRAEECRRLVAAGAEVNAQDAEGYTPLMLAAEKCSVETCRALLELGADPNLTDAQGECALVKAALLYLHRPALEICRMLLAAGADPHSRLPEEDATLLHAIDERQEWLLDALLRAGADPCLPLSSGTTPLHYVSTLRACRLLLAAGANPLAADAAGSTPISVQTALYQEKMTPKRAEILRALRAASRR